MMREPAVEEDFERASLKQLCELVVSYVSAWEDVAEHIEDRAFADCGDGGVQKVVETLQQVAVFFEQMEQKSDENCQDLLDVYLLIGEIYQSFGNVQESIDWFCKGVVVDDRAAEPFHSLAISYIKINELPQAIRSLEQEIVLDPGHYYSYFMLADLYEQVGGFEQLEQLLHRLLERDPDNIQALHRLITWYQKVQPEAEIELLRRRLLRIRKEFNKLELIIWSYHMVQEGRGGDALRFLLQQEQAFPKMSMINLLKAAIYDEQKLWGRKRSELAQFKNKNSANQDLMGGKLAEFGKVFGEQAAQRLQPRPLLTTPPASAAIN